MGFSVRLCVALVAVLGQAQTPVTIQVHGNQRSEPMRPSWAYFGYDEPNYTYTKNGRKLIGELAKLSPQPIHVRTHFFLTTGDGTGALKWGSTNAYTEDASGKPVYDWTIVDKIVGTYVSAGAIPFIEIGFMPKALSTHPEPYTPVWKPHSESSDYNLGWTYPPNDYKKWEELIYQWVKHSIEKYGKAEVEKWDWEVWNEPDIGYWHGTPEEYNKLYDYSAAAVKRALPTARVGGPASTGPQGQKAGAFLRQFLEHCASGQNFATGAQGSPLDFISFHAKGNPKVVDGRVRMGIARELQDVAKGFEIVRAFPKFQHLPIVLSEADPEGCAACSARAYPQNAYRNGTLYPSYEAVALKALLELASRDGMELKGILTWAFEFEGQPYFDGFRTLATNGVDKPVLNMFRMTGLFDGEMVKAESNAAVGLGRLLEQGVPESAVDAMASRSDRTLTMMVWNYSDQDGEGPGADIALKVDGLPAQAKTLRAKHYRIDDRHSNAYTKWKEMGSPQNPTKQQYGELERAGRLQKLEPARKLSSKQGVVELKLNLPMHGLSLVQLSW